MFYQMNLRFPLNSLRPALLLAALILCLSAVDVAAQTNPGDAATPAPALPAAAPAAKDEAAADAPAFQEYKGVRIGMAAVEARRKLGTPTDKSDTQDFYLISDKENLQVRYDAAKKVSTLAIIYLNAGANALTPKAVLGSDIEANPDGSRYKLVRYPKAGYWVSYSRTAGNSPIVSVTMQKIN